MASNFRQLGVWNRAVELSVDIYKVTKSFPQEERLGLAAHIRKTSISIASNIAEGSGRGSNAQFIYFLDIAQGSAFELETQLIIAQKVGFILKIKAEQLLSELNIIEKMISSLKKALQQTTNKHKSKTSKNN